MSRPVLFLDVNIPMYAAGTHHPLKDACVWVMKEVSEERLEVAIDTEIVQEILHRFGSLQRWETGATMAWNVLDLIQTVYPVTVSDTRKAIEFFTKYGPVGVSSRDALHAAVMQNNGLTHILSADDHFDRIDGIMRVPIGTLARTRSKVERMRE